MDREFYIIRFISKVIYKNISSVENIQQPVHTKTGGGALSVTSVCACVCLVC